MRESSEAPVGKPTGGPETATYLLFFVSGFAGLVYEVLWMKELGLLFGNTAQAAATTLAAFFLGLVGGARFWGVRAGRMRRPLRAYAALEAGVALTALLHFVLLDAYHALYAPLFQALGGTSGAFLASKFALALAVLFPPSFLMGGTLPVMSQHLVRRPEALGRTASLLYAVNTAGAAVGAFAAGFHLPRSLGFNRSYAVAVAATVGVAVLAWWLDRQRAEGSAEPHDAPEEGRPGGTAVLSIRTVRALAFGSGFASLALEVLWTRMFAQVLQNSVYTFATILVVFLAALALGAALASALMRRAGDPRSVLPLLLAASALLVGATPFAFHWITGGLAYFGGERGFGSYVLGAFGTASVVMLAPGVLVGSVFPYLMRLAEPLSRSVGRTVGDLAAINTLGAAAGSLTAGFVLLDLLGLWASLRLVATAYLCAALLLGGGVARSARWSRALAVTTLLLLASVLDPARLPVVKVDPVDAGESVLAVWEESAGITAVVRRPDSLNLKLDNDYSLGGTAAALYEQGQAHLPLLLHPRPRSVFFLGMGTGITAGAALDHPVERVVVSELVPAVVEAARTFFVPHVNGLFEDPRAEVVAEDGRNFLFGTAERFDLVVADLFMPWKAGVGSLYSREHYQAGRARLRDGGLYVQWLPLYQMSRRDFGVIARTMREVFPQLTLWRGTIAPGWETVALIGHESAEPLDRDALQRRLRESGRIALGAGPGPGQDDGAELSLELRDLLIQYCGNLSAAPALLDGFPVNTDDAPIVEYEAPIAHRRARAGQAALLVGRELFAVLGELLVQAPPERDPYLEELGSRETALVRAGLSLYLSQVLRQAGDERGAREALSAFERVYGGGVGERAQTRRELLELIAKYDSRIRALREHLEEVDATASDAASDSGAGGAGGRRP